MTKDPFIRKPIRTSKSGGTKCTTCEMTVECGEAAKCIYPLLCVSLSIAECPDATMINADAVLRAVRYDCDLNGWDLSFDCGGYLIDLLLTYEEVYGEPTAVLRSYYLGIEVTAAFTDAINASCPHFDFDIGMGTVTVRKYEMVSIGQQKALDRAPDDCTAGRCLPRYLCADVYTVSRPDEPYTMQMEWYTNDTVTINDICCCAANDFPEMLIARVVNFSAGCTCIGPQRVSTIYYTAEQAAAVILDPGAILHLRHRIAYPGEAIVDGYPNVPAGAHVWVSEGVLGDDLAPLCPAPEQEVNDYTLDLYGRLVLWCDPVTGTFQSCFEIVNYTGALNAGNTEYLTPFKQTNPFSNVYRISDGRILCCNPFQIELAGIVESDFCQDTDSQNGEGVLRIHVGEFQGWVGTNPTDTTRRIALYSERINAAAPPQTLAQDCLPKIHVQTYGDTFKGRTDKFSVSQIWPAHVWDHSEFVLAADSGYHQIQRIVVYPRSCDGCNSPPPIDRYAPISNGCCPEPTPRTLYATAVEDNDCPCAGGTTVVLEYVDADEAWYGEASFGDASGCGRCTVTMRLSCSNLIGDAIWQLEWGFVGSGTTIWTPQAPGNDPVFTCSPFFWYTRSVSSNTCCNPQFAASFFHWVITA